MCASANGAGAGNESGLRAGLRAARADQREGVQGADFAAVAGGPHFWYQNRLRDGREWVLVDGAAGKRQAFSDKAKFEKARDALAAKVDLPPKPEKSPRKDHWKSPDGKWRVFARDYNVWIRATEGNEEIQLSHDGKEQDRYEGYLRWSPDSRYIGIVRRQQVDERRVQYVESSPSKQLQPKSFTRVYAKPGDKIPTHTVHVFEAGKGWHISRWIRRW